MRVAITGGTGLVGAAIARAAVRAGHSVRIVTRHEPDRLQRDNPLLRHVAFHAADVTDAGALRGAFDAIDVVIHAAGIAREDGPESTFRSVNVDGTRHVVAECARAGSPRLIFLSSLGADRGSSDYHASKRQAEDFVRRYNGPWIILRPGNVYGAEGGEIALFLALIRVLPAVPVVGDTDIPFQPVAAEDLALAVVACCDNDAVLSGALEIAGTDITSQRDLYDRITRMIDRHPPLLPLPEFVALAGAGLMQQFGISPPVWKDQLQMIADGNVIANRDVNALRDVLGIVPRSLEQGLRELAHDTPEQMPDQGSGTVVRRRFWVDVNDCRYDPETLMQLVRRDFVRLMPQSMLDVGTEQVSERELTNGATISLALPVRGHVQVRVEEVTKHSVTCVTLEGHPLTGVVRFLSEHRGPCVRFEVQTIDRPHNPLDRLVMALLGTHLKRITWFALLRNVAREATDTVEHDYGHEEEPLDDAQSDHIATWIHDLVAKRLQQDEEMESGSHKRIP